MTEQTATEQSDASENGNDHREFRSCVRRCACDGVIVAQFNKLCGTTLKVPVEALACSGPLPGADSMEGQQIAQFPFFVRVHVWQRVRLARRAATMENAC